MTVSRAGDQDEEDAGQVSCVYQLQYRNLNAFLT